ncbi:MAG: SDR family NAD(P)-dependent oxidoreductase [Leucobacter sp.]
MTRFNGKVAVITGGAGEIGTATARKFLDEGAKVVLVDLKEEGLKQRATDLDAGESLAYVAADVTKSDDVAAYVKFATDTFGKIDIFFNNAGIEGVVQPIADYPEDVFDQVIAVNVKGVFLGLKHVMPVIAEGGAIINTSSVSGLKGDPGVSAYVASKHAVIGLTRTAALEGAARQVRVNSIHPSPVTGRMMDSLEEGFSPGSADVAHEQLAAQIPLGRYAAMDDIANGVLLLASDEAKFISASKLVVDGGLTQH